MSRIIDASVGLASLVGSVSTGCFVYETSQAFPYFYKEIINYERFTETGAQLFTFAGLGVIEAGLGALSAWLGYKGITNLYHTIKPEKPLENLLRMG